MYYAFGKLLSANTWKNQQYIEMPYGSGISSINQAELMFEDSISFVLTSDEYQTDLLCLLQTAGQLLHLMFMKN